MAQDEGKDHFHLALPVAVGETLRARAKQFAPGTIEAYVAALVKGRPLAPMPQEFRQVGVCITSAIEILKRITVDDSDLLQALRLLFEAQGYGLEVARVWNTEKRDGFNVDEGAWRSTGGTA